MRKRCLPVALSLLLVVLCGRPVGAVDAGTEAGVTEPSATGTGAIVTLWPLFDYRSSPATGYRNLAILGPLFKRELSGDTTRTAIRPLFFTQAAPAAEESDILYPLASTSSSGAESDTQVLRLFQRHVSKTGTPEEKRDTMLFPFYISGTSETHGPYTSLLPFHGAIYDRFWRDEYHYTLFPLYGRTVRNGTVSTNWLYPFFNRVSGDKESGFAFWPLYGQSAKEGVYEKRFLLWPFFFEETLGKDTANPVENLFLLPFYASSRSPQRSATYAPWPFCGVVRDAGGEVVERNILWPFLVTKSGKDADMQRWLPFYSESRVKDTASRWVMWPLYREETIASPDFRQQKTSLLYFLFTRSDESWPRAGRERARSTLWPLYAWKRDEEGWRTLSLPALAESVIWNDGVERNWAPLWRLFIAKWDDRGNGVTSVLWNLFWREKRGAESAWELSPLISWRSTRTGTELRLFKGLFGYKTDGGGTSVSILWIPFGGGGE